LQINSDIVIFHNVFVM